MTKKQATYVDGFVLVVPKKRVAEYRAMARDGGRIWMKYGALEYKECQSTEHFIAGVRFTFFASFILLFSILIGAYYAVWITPESNLGPGLKPHILIGVSVFGFITSIVGWIVEERNTAIIRILGSQSILLEEEMGPAPGNRLRIRQRLDTSESRRRVFLRIGARHAVAIRAFYFVIGIVWNGLIFYSIYLASW